jgi:hypothetical protein
LPQKGIELYSLNFTGARAEKKINKKKQTVPEDTKDSSSAGVSVPTDKR